MPLLRITPNLRRHVECPDAEVPGTTVREVLDAYFERYPAVRGYVVDDQCALRKHMAVFVAGKQLQDRERLTDEVPAAGVVDVVQSLSGG